MVERLHHMMETTRRRVSLSYHAALILIALVVILIALATNHLISAQINSASIINLAGKQRMLSQRIALLTQDLVVIDNENRRQTLQALMTAIDTMESNHHTLLLDATMEGSPPALSSTPSSLYFSPPHSLDARVKAYIAHARAVLKLSALETTFTQPDVAALLNQAHNGMLESLDAVVTRYQSAAVERFTLLHQVIMGLAAMALLLLVVIALVVFKPALAYVSQAQKRVMELNQLKGDFLANMSHEIRTPMNGIFGMTELLLDSRLSERQQHYVRTLQNSADHLLGLINDILDFSKLEAGQMKLDPIRFDLLSTIEDVLDLLAPRAREKKLELILRYAPNAPRFIIADPGRIRQVLFNLIGNAIKFTDDGYVLVNVELARPMKETSDIRLRLSIEDTGIGIAEEKLPSLFEKFVQLESGSTRAQQGTGLGLAICRNLLKLMNGDIRAKSVSGKGTTFICEMPLPYTPQPSSASLNHTALAGKRFLFVDDLAPNRQLFKETLKEAGAAVLLAENADEAMSILRYAHENDEILNGIVIDYAMPDIDGLSLTREIKRSENFASLPIIALNSTSEDLSSLFEEAGAAAMLAKPLTRRQLLSTLSHIVTAAKKGAKQPLITLLQNTAEKERASSVHVLRGTQVLLVEDNRVNLEITSEMLSQFGCQVTPADTGLAALDAVRGRVFDLIFMDCQMPEMDGYETARRIRLLEKEEVISPVPIIAITANALKGDRERCLESGMDDYLSKPVRKANLEAILLKWLKTAETFSPAVPVPEEPIAPPFPPSAYGIDDAAFDAAKRMLGDKLPLILTYYLEDAEGYIERIAQAVAQNNPGDAAIPAHTLKSSSRQLGVMQLAELAERAEAMARDTSGSEENNLAALLPTMRDALSHVRPFFQSAA